MKRVICQFLCSCACLAYVICHGQTNPPTFLEAGTSAFEAHHYGAALTNFSKAIQLNPQAADAYCGRGMCKWWLHDYAGAVADYDKSIALNPTCGGYYCNRGQAKFAMKKCDDALADYNKSIHLDPGNAQAFFNRGSLKVLCLTNYTGAIADFTEAIELHTDPHPEDIYFMRGCARHQLKDFAGAIADYSKVLELKPSSEWGNVALAKTNLSLAREQMLESQKK
ncbi:MAG TPA: tetratricopeptide repeat protein [Verrucomicrobiae bacterium]|nr:tetratricopeptide repeat protein [Verrucomicrobiae bacterium]